VSPAALAFLPRCAPKTGAGDGWSRCARPGRLTGAPDAARPGWGSCRSGSARRARGPRVLLLPTWLHPFPPPAPRPEAQSTAGAAPGLAPPSLAAPRLPLAGLDGILSTRGFSVSRCKEGLPDLSPAWPGVRTSPGTSSASPSAP
jgi:hypothetical protein